MTIRSSALCLALAIAAAASPMIASARVYLDIDVAPPAPREEVIPAARVGYVWSPGYWNWSGSEHVWVGGSWIHERPGHHWTADRWEQRGTHWHHEPGHWD